MIVVDENIHDRRIIEAISAWYPGQVASITTLRPGTIIHDDAIPTVLLQASQPTFVTINVSDFWPKIQPHNSYCSSMAELEEGIKRIRDGVRMLD